MIRRHARSALLALAALLFGAVVALPSAQAQTPYKVTIAGVTPVRNAGTIAFHGTVAPASPGASASVQEYSAGAWRRIATVTLSATSTYSVRVAAGSVDRTRKFRVVKVAGPTRAAGASATLSVVVTSKKYVITAFPDPSPSYGRGDLMYLSGGIAPPTPGRPIVMQEWDGLSWVTVARTTSSLTGAFYTPTTLQSPGTHRFRVVVSGYGSYLGAASQNFDLDVAGSTLRAGEVYRSGGQGLLSPNGRFSLQLGWDGALFVFPAEGGHHLWNNGVRTGTDPRMVLQGDGNLVIQGRDGSVLWQTGPHAGAGAYLSVQDDGNAVIKDGAGAVLWASNSLNDWLNQGEVLRPGWNLRSADKRFQVVMQTDGNLVMYGPSGPVWASHTVSATLGNYAVMQTDGNLVVYSASGTPLWASQTPGHPNSFVVVQNDGNFVVYSPTGPTWASKSSAPPATPAAPIADTALRFVGQYGGAACVVAGRSGMWGGAPLGSGNNDDGECRAFANCVVWIASGHRVWIGAGANEFTNLAAHGTQVTWATAAKGDIVQWPMPYDNLHTAIVVANLGGGRLDVVDSNFGLNHKVQHHVITQSWRPGSRIYRIAI